MIRAAKKSPQSQSSKSSSPKVIDNCSTKAHSSRFQHHAPITLISMTFNWVSGPLAEGLHCYNTAQFFAAHEHWESVWLTAPQPEKTFLQALIQVTVAMHHLTRSNSLGATRLLTAALRKLKPLPPNFANLDVALLRDDIRLALETVAPRADVMDAVILSVAKDPCISAVPNIPAPRIQPTTVVILSEAKDPDTSRTT
jgi:predicted metal-dependent hydrolase